MNVRGHLRLVSVILASLAGAGLLTVGFGLTPLSGSIFGPYLGLGPKGDFSLSSNSPLTITRGQTGTFLVTVTSINHLSGDVSVSATLLTSATTPPIVSASLSSVKLTPDETASLTVTIATTSSTSLGNYNITVQGKTTDLSHSITLSVDVTQPPPPPSPDFSLSIIPSSMTATRGSYATGTVTVSSLQGFSGTVTLTVALYPLPSNPPVVSLNLTSLKLRSGATNSTLLLVNAYNATIGNYNVAVTGASGSLSHVLNIALTVNGSVSGEALNFQSYSIDSTTQLTLTIMNFGSVNTRFVSYYVVDASNDQYSLTSWNGPTINQGQTGTVTILIGASCSGCVLSGSSFTFVSGNTYRIILVSALNNQFTLTIGQPTSQEHISIDAFSFTSSTNVTLYVRNTGTVSVQLTAYSVKDASGDSYSLATFAGPTIPPNQVVAVSFTIGSSCTGCTLSGNAFTFMAGYSYSIIITTARNNFFTFTATR
jgi:hypothetical protein